MSPEVLLFSFLAADKGTDVLTGNYAKKAAVSFARDNEYKTIPMFSINPLACSTIICLQELCKIHPETILNCLRSTNHVFNFSALPLCAVSACLRGLRGQNYLPQQLI